MQRLEVRGAVRRLYVSLGVKGLISHKRLGLPNGLLPSRFPTSLYYYTYATYALGGRDSPSIMQYLTSLCQLNPNRYIDSQFFFHTNDAPLPRSVAITHHVPYQSPASTGTAGQVPGGPTGTRTLSPRVRRSTLAVTFPLVLTLTCSCRTCRVVTRRFYSRLRKIAKSDYQLFHVCLSVRLH